MIFPYKEIRNIKAPFGTWKVFGTQKVLGKGKKTKKNDFLMFGFLVENIKEN